MPALKDVLSRGLLSARPTAGTAGRRYIATDAGESYDDGSAWQPIGSVSENFRTSDVTVTPANAFVDGNSLTLGPGTYLLDAVLTLDNATTGWMTAKIWDGTTLMSAGPSEYMNKAGGAIALAIHGYVVLSSTTTVKVSVAMQQAGGHILATDPQGNGPTNKASYFRAVRIA